jgi:nicotinate-nucleotide pyrophosphorylase (carboxylating)
MLSPSDMTYHAGADLWKHHLEKGLDEDGWKFDWTTLSSLSDEAQAASVTARVVAKASGVWAAEGLIYEIRRVSLEMGMPLRVEALKSDGEMIHKGDVVCTWVGPARAVLALERPFLNLASFVCGIATRTRALVAAAEDAAVPGAKPPILAPRITATRKTLPGYRDLSLHGVLCGGGSVHRVNLFSGVLIKENHIAAAGGITEAVKSARSRAPHGLKIEVEVRDDSELDEALAAGAEIVMLDNFTPDDAAEASKKAKARRPDVLIEVSGGIDVDNVALYVEAGIDIVSSGSITHSAGSLDLSLLIEEKP